MKKIIVIVLALAAIAVATVPLWGSCDLNYQVCTTWCEAKHYNSDVKVATCKAGCSADKLSCLGKQMVK